MSYDLSKFTTPSVFYLGFLKTAQFEKTYATNKTVLEFRTLFFSFRILSSQPNPSKRVNRTHITSSVLEILNRMLEVLNCPSQVFSKLCFALMKKMPKRKLSYRKSKIPYISWI